MIGYEYIRYVYVLDVCVRSIKYYILLFRFNYIYIMNIFISYAKKNYFLLFVVCLNVFSPLILLLKKNIIK
ncbi:hypothetical protein BCR32DRAFT_102983 [Anaeromyces robustus]|uniref:Uncharacterized protein n=1 Tax=Anaeromyces robustus TaxID=1754192 RepID=A0A1Y1XIC2_9FUNG|nr:hypothetical protein BCR32DRAFT_102983 [Anaeromyces robustus]|eukprot:ORX85116.1 hypothetical protein BCR32DRAFT_102983 [Anaeromyces robustus]